MKEEAADIAIKKKPVEKEPPKKEVVKEVPKPIEKVPPKKEVVKEVPKPVKVTPPHGRPYYLIDERGDGKFSRQESHDTGLRPPMWVIHSW